ncbi:MAG TPA: hypothetical protein VFB21_02510 [Chthonomonadaceae bacterium]|nr:hypothetical protein [Chthonomonadaceae bacterium]
MAQPQIIEGTTEEIVTLLQGGAFAGRKARIIFEPDEEDFTDNLPDPPTAVRDAAHLEQLLLEGLASPAREMTEADWQELHRRAQSRIKGQTF